MKRVMATVPEADDGGGRRIEKPVGVEAVMDFLGVSHSCVYELMAKGLVPYHQVGGQRRFYLTEVDAVVRGM